mmetsp:Transcript_16618/g.28316  ORF Transcript_16618/g.28316 Transcript_16618/m.28316 type:complete len:127 (+) Transcript_16618:395-775(+)
MKYVRTLLRSHFKILKRLTVRRLGKAQRYADLQLQFKVFQLLRRASKKQKVSNRIERKMREIYQLQKSKVIFRAWREMARGARARISAIGEENGGNFNFCVKFSDFCSCPKCLRRKQNFDQIGPLN